METSTYSSRAQNEALINELKGGLFEYLTAAQIAASQESTGSFLRGIPPELKGRLGEYEAWLRRNDPELLSLLPRLAGETARRIAPRLPPPGESGRVDLCGRRFERTDSLGEADILVRPAKVPAVGIGLKLCKTDSFVNTKSGGIRSFLTKYFENEFGKDALDSQRSLNLLLNQSFHRMAGDLYASAGLEYPGEWNKEWEGSGLSLLPGGLTPERRKILFAHYRRVTDELHRIVKSFWQKNPCGMVRSLAPLLGFINRDLIQAVCFYTGKYKLHDVTVLDGRTVDWDKIPVRLGPRRGNSNFEFLLEDRTLQIRVKPMNRFNAKALKINCSVKWKPL